MNGHTHTHIPSLAWDCFVNADQVKVLGEMDIKKGRENVSVV